MRPRKIPISLIFLGIVLLPSGFVAGCRQPGGPGPKDGGELAGDGEMPLAPLPLDDVSRKQFRAALEREMLRSPPVDEKRRAEIDNWLDFLDFLERGAAGEGPRAPGTEPQEGVPSGKGSQEAAPRDRGRDGAGRGGDADGAGGTEERGGGAARRDRRPLPPSLREAERLRESGDSRAALAELYALADELRDGGADSPQLRWLLGSWALEAKDGVLAEEQFEAVAASAAASAALAEKARSQVAVARALALGPDASALAEAQALADGGAFRDAVQRLDALAVAATEPSVRKKAESLKKDLVERSREKAAADLGRADLLLSGPGPWDAVGPLLDGVEALPAGTWDEAEARRLRAWHRAVQAEQDTARAESDRAALQRRLDEARAMVAGGRYRDAIGAYRKLDGSALQTTARQEARQAADSFVKEERDRAGRLFVAAKKLGDAEKRRAALSEVRTLLAGLLEEFPDSTYAARVSENLAAVERELGAAGGGG
jgi:hypothetical protein